MLKWIPIKSSIANNKGIYTFVYRKWLSLKYVLDWAEHLQQGLYTLEGVEYTTPFIAYTRWQIAKWFEYTLNILSKLLLRLYCNHICRDFSLIRDFPGGSEGKTSVVKASVYSAGDLGSIPGSGRFPREANGNPLQHSCLENPMGGGAWCPWGLKESDMTEWLHSLTLS